MTGKLRGRSKRRGNEHASIPGELRAALRPRATVPVELPDLDVLALLHDAVILVDRRQHVVYANGAAEWLFGYGPGELLESELDRLVPSHMRAVHGLWADGFMKGTARTALMRPDTPVIGLRKDGAEVPVEISLTAVPTEQGPIVVAVIRDLSDVDRVQNELIRHEQHYQALFEQALEGIIEANLDNEVLDANASVRQLFAIADDVDVTTLHLREFVTDAETASAVRTRVAELGHVRQQEIQLRRTDGSTFWASLSAQLVTVHGGQRRVRLRIVDITHRVEAEAAQREVEARFRAVLHNSVDAVVIADADRVVHYASPSAERMFGPLLLDRRCTPAEWRDVVHQDDQQVLDHIDDVLDRALIGHHEFELRFQGPTGELLHVVLGVQNLRHDPSIRGWVWQIRNVTDQRRVEAELAYSTGHDQLTGLSNRADLEDRMREAVERIDLDGVPVGVLVLDLDRFKVVNDSLGFSAGNHVLRTIAARLQATLRHIDCLARLSADEFGIVVRLQDRGRNRPFTDELSRVSALADRVLQHVSYPIEVGGEVVTVTGSIGIALATTGRDPAAALLRDADHACGLAKAAGGNGFAFFDPDSRLQAEERHRLERELRTAITEDRLELLFQPIADLRTGVILGLEALLRWHDSTGRLVLPDECLDLAEEAGLMPAINEWVLTRVTQVLAQLQTDRRIAEAPYVSVNTTARQVSSPHFVDQVMTALALAGADPAGLIVEITEHGLIRDLDACRDTLQGLHANGVLIALDDFGTGYSSLSYLHRLPFDIVKIDRSFVQALADVDAGDRSPLAPAIVAMAKGLGLETIAEGVETPAQMAALIAAGCVAGQGWGIARACSLEDAVQLVIGAGTRNTPDATMLSLSELMSLR